MKLAILSFFSSRIRCLAVKTGMSELCGINADASLDNVVDASQRGIPILLLDLLGGSADKPSTRRCQPVGGDIVAFQRLDYLGTIRFKSFFENVMDKYRREMDTRRTRFKEKVETVLEICSGYQTRLDVCFLARVIDLYRRDNPKLTEPMPLWLQHAMFEADGTEATKAEDFTDVRDILIKLCQSLLIAQRFLDDQSLRIPH